MKKKWSRREFAQAGLMGAAAVGGRSLGRFGEPVQSETKERPSPGLAPDLRALLHAAADEIVPGSDGMPAASEVGTLEYLEGILGLSKVISRQFLSGLPSLETISRRRFQGGFLSLSRARRVEVLAELEKSSPEFFAALRDSVYEGYYLQPAVWKSIGYEFYPSRGPVPPIEPFDEAVLRKVAARPKLYRPAGS